MFVALPVADSSRAQVWNEFKHCPLFSFGDMNVMYPTPQIPPVDTF